MQAFVSRRNCCAIKRNSRTYFIILLFFVLTMGRTTLVAACDVPIVVYWASDATLLADAAVLPLLSPKTAQEHEKSLMEFIENAQLNVDYVNRLVAGAFTACLQEVRVAGIELMSSIPALKVDRAYWNEVKRAAKNRTLSRSAKAEAKKRAAEACGRLVLGLGTFADSIRETGQFGVNLYRDSTIPATVLAGTVAPKDAELPVVVIMTGRTTGEATCNNLSSVGYIESIKGTFTDSLSFLSEFSKNFGSYVGVQLNRPGVPAVRENEKGDLRPYRSAIHIIRLEPQDKTFVHELGHYLGLSHLAADGAKGVLGLCSDNDLELSNVTDTPGMRVTLNEVDKKYLDVTPSTLPETDCSPVTDEFGVKHSKMPLDNLLNQGDYVFPNLPARFTRSQISVMKRMVSLLLK
jgi:hypothetical protein